MKKHKAVLKQNSLHFPRHYNKVVAFLNNNFVDLSIPIMKHWGLSFHSNNLLHNIGIFNLMILCEQQYL